jgi:uroporphyrinogen decarboxylase
MRAIHAMHKMTHRALLEATIGGAAVDRSPVALWRHWPVDDQEAGELARASLTFQRDYDFDFIKVTPNSNFAVEGYGAQSEWIGNEEGTRAWGERVIQQPEDWLALRPLDPRQGLLGEVLEANRMIGASVQGETPFIQTIFNPLAEAKNLAGARLAGDLRLHPEAVKVGLRTITDSILRFVAELKPTGVSGIFLAIQHASYDLLSEAEYRDFCLPLDLEILGAAKELWLNVVHLHGNNVMFDLVSTYPAQVINWHDTETPPSLADALSKTQMVLCGGLRQWQTMVRGTPEGVRVEAHQALEATQRRRLILGTGCVTPIIAPTCNLIAARRAVED